MERTGSGWQGRTDDLREEARTRMDTVEDESTAAMNPAPGTSSDGGQQSGGAMDTAREKASEVGQKAQEGVEQGRQQAASGLSQAAETLRERSEGSSGVASDAGVKVAEGMESAAGYLQTHTSTEIWTDVEGYVRQHPGQALAGAIVTGFLIGRILR